MIKPFAKPEQEFMMMHNSIIDIIMPLCSNTEFKVLMAIFRKTRGWDKDVDRISYSQLMEMTGIKGSATISKAISGLQEKGMILMQSGDVETANSYSLNVEYSMPTSKNEEPLLQKMKYPTSKNEDTKDTIKDNINIKRLTPNGGPEYVDAGKEFEKSKNEDTHKAVVGALMEVTKLDMNIKTNAGRIYKVSKELRDAGYGVDDILEFGRQWKRDWRYRADGKPPIPEVILKEICHIKKVDSPEERKRKAIEQIERARQGNPITYEVEEDYDVAERRRKAIEQIEKARQLAS